MLNNPLAQKLLALAVDRVEGYFNHSLDPSDPVGKVITKVMENASPDVKKQFPVWQSNLRTFRALPPSRQQVFLGKYYDRRMILEPNQPPMPNRAIPVHYEEIPRPAGSISTRPVPPWHKKKYYANISLEMDEIYVADEDDPGKAEVIVIGGASDGVRAHGLVSQTKGLGEEETGKFYGEDRVAVPNWPLSTDGTSKITFYCEVRELDSSDREQILEATGGAAGIAGAIIGGLVAGGVIGGPAGAIAGAVVGGIVGLIKLLVALNSDDDWGEHQIDLAGPYPIPSANPHTIIKEKRPGGEHYELRFIRKLYSSVPLRQCDYEIDVTTGSVKHAGTDAHVYMTFFGSKAMTGEMRIDYGGRDDFEKSHTDVFNYVLDDLGELKKIRVRHDNTRDNPGWFLEQIIIKNKNDSHSWKFPCHRWLAKDEDDGRLERELIVQP